MKNTQFTALVFILLSIPQSVPADQYGVFSFTSSGNAVTITRYSGAGGAVYIPDNINGYPVISIGDDAFSACSSLTSVTIPGSVSNIKNRAFQYCTKLTSVTIMGNITNISDGAFSECYGLTSFSVPASTMTIGNKAFDACSSLLSINVDSANAYYKSVDGILFNKNQTTIIQCPGGKVGTYTIPSTVTNIATIAFNECYNLTSVSVPATATSIGDGAFGECSSLLSINVDSANAYYKSVDGILFNKSQTILIQCPGGKAGSYSIPSTVTNVGKSSFTHCTNLTSITIPNSVTTIGDHSFWRCLSLTNITIPASVSNIGDYAFWMCNGLTKVFFQGTAPVLNGQNVFASSPNVTIYYLATKPGWGATFAGRPTMLWNPIVQITNSHFGVRTNRFGFDFTGLTNTPMVVETCTNLLSGVWTPLQTNTLSNGSYYFTDPIWQNYRARLYRIRFL